MTIRHEALLRGAKNLLAFSGGTDSTALYHILKDKDIDFDIAIVAYNIRDEAKDELDFAKLLAKQDNKKIYILEAKLKKSNLELNARNIRYNFFDKIILENSYEYLITAHQLNDKLEWFLMQLSKGAGIVELYGFLDISKTQKYDIVRPLIELSKKSILEYLKAHSIKYFYDTSNSDTKYKRNYFRHNYSDKLIDEFEDGIRNSFKYIKEDIKTLPTNKSIKIKHLNIAISSGIDNIDIRYIDKTLKELGVLISAKQRTEIIRTKDCVVSAKFAVCFTEDKIFIAPFIKHKLNKKQKELFRINKIPPKIRAYITKYNIDITLLNTTKEII